jgi:hypothetical protein
MFNDYVVKHDDFIKLTNSFSTIGEYRAINCCLNLLGPEDLLIEGLAYSVDITRYADVSSLPYAVGYSDLVLFMKTHRNTFFNSVDLNEHLKLMKVIWKPEIIPLISGEMQPKTFIKSKLAMDNVQSYKQYRLYEKLQKYLKVISIKGDVRVFTADLREAANCVTTYKDYTEFARNIIKPTLTSIEKELGIKLAVKGSRREVVISKKQI